MIVDEKDINFYLMKMKFLQKYDICKSMNYVFVIFSGNDNAILDLKIKAEISSGSFYHEFHKLDIYQFIVRMFL